MSEIVVKEEREALSFVDPELYLDRASRVADVLSQIIEKRKLYATLGGRKYVTCEGWTTLAALAGLVPKVEEVVVEKDGDVWEARAVAVLTKSGQSNLVVARAVAYCRSDERKFQGRSMQEKHEVASMAQTRAVSKVCRLVLSWIMTLAGYEPTPAEEVENVYSINQENKEEKKNWTWAEIEKVATEALKHVVRKYKNSDRPVTRQELVELFNKYEGDQTLVINAIMESREGEAC